MITWSNIFLVFCHCQFWIQCGIFSLNFYISIANWYEPCLYIKGCEVCSTDVSSTDVVLMILLKCALDNSATHMLFETVQLKLWPCLIYKYLQNLMVYTHCNYACAFVDIMMKGNLYL